jgi:hypothetical protein
VRAFRGVDGRHLEECTRTRGYPEASHLVVGNLKEQTVVRIGPEMEENLVPFLTVPLVSDFDDDGPVQR